jgi:hypothetical protein
VGLGQVGQCLQGTKKGDSYAQYLAMNTIGGDLSIGKKVSSPADSCDVLV